MLSFCAKNTVFLLKICENIHTFFEKKKEILTGKMKFLWLETLYNPHDYQHENTNKIYTALKKKSVKKKLHHMITNPGSCYMQTRKCKIYFWTCIFYSNNAFFFQFRHLKSPLYPQEAQPVFTLFTMALFCRSGWGCPGCPSLLLSCPVPALGTAGWSPDHREPVALAASCWSTLQFLCDLPHNTKSGNVLTVEIRSRDCYQRLFF